MRILLTILAMWGFAVLVGLPDPVRAANADCDILLDQAPSQLFYTSDTYAFISTFDEAGCETASADAFDQMISVIEVNAVSYALLEERLLPDQTEFRSQIIASFVDAYFQEYSGLDVSSALALIDIAFYGCGGDADCIAQRIDTWRADTPLLPEAQCLFGQTRQCKDDAPDLPFLNDATLRLSPEPETALRARDDFICRRYLACK